MFCCIWIEQMVGISLRFWLFSCVNELSVTKGAWLTVGLLELLTLATLCYNKNLLGLLCSF